MLLVQGRCGRLVESCRCLALAALTIHFHDPRVMKVASGAPGRPILGDFRARRDGSEDWMRMITTLCDVRQKLARGSCLHTLCSLARTLPAWYRTLGI